MTEFEVKVYEEMFRAMDLAEMVLRDKYGNTEEVQNAIESAAYDYWDAFTQLHV